MMRKLLAVALLCSSAAAQAEWREATSKNFIVYGEGSEQRLRETVTKLEKYKFMLRFASNVKAPPSPLKIKIYLMRNIAAVGDTLPSGGSGVAGYYTASPRGPIAVSTRSDTGGQFGLTGQQVLFHELAHHFMFQYFPATYPSWYSEGFADYYGTARILDKDVIEVGHLVENRYLSLQQNEWLPLDKLLTAKSYSDVGGNIYLLYAQGWLLVHYLANNKERTGQLQKYLNGINAGQSYESAMNAAFGEGARKLNSELRDYAGRSRMTVVALPFKPIDVGPIEIRTLRPVEEDLIRHEIALGSGVLKTKAAKFAQEVRAIAGRAGEDPYALRILTEAERIGGNNAAASQAVDRWLAARPGDGLAMMHKGELQIEALRAARSTDKAAWRAARKLILDGNKAAPNNPQILAAYYNSFVAEGVMPPAGAQNGLYSALELVPQDEGLRYQLASDFEHRGMIQEAITIIKPAAMTLHSDEDDPKKKKRQQELREKYRAVGDDRTETAREMLARLEKKLGGGAPAAAAPAALQVQ